VTHTTVTPALTGYIEDRFATEDPVLIELRSALSDHGMPSIQVSPSTGRVLEILVRATGGRRVLEIGTLGGYSAIWMARGLASGGTLTTLELNSDHAEFARRFLHRAGVADRVEVREGDARSILPGLGPDGSYDLVFVDADKAGYATYAQQAWRLLRPGGLLVADNLLWSGRIVEEAEDEDTRALQRFNEELARGAHPATILPVGDGLGVAVKSG
jgi:predicted O-methyltransferase YrrM